MMDKEGAPRQPTGANIKAELKRLVQISEPGDFLVFSFSGHGSQVSPPVSLSSSILPAFSFRIKSNRIKSNKIE